MLPRRFSPNSMPDGLGSRGLWTATPPLRAKVAYGDILWFPGAASSPLDRLGLAAVPLTSRSPRADLLTGVPRRVDLPAERQHARELVIAHSLFALS